MANVKIKITDEDYQAALRHFTLIDWDRVKSKAREKAAERLLLKNREATELAMTLADADKHNLAAYLRHQDEITRLFKEHDALLDIAFPSSSPEGKNG